MGYHLAKNPGLTYSSKSSRGQRILRNCCPYTATYLSHNAVRCSVRNNYLQPSRRYGWCSGYSKAPPLICIPELLERMDSYKGQPLTRLATKLTLLSALFSTLLDNLLNVQTIPPVQNTESCFLLFLIKGYSCFI